MRMCLFSTVKKIRVIIGLEIQKSFIKAIIAIRILLIIAILILRHNSHFETHRFLLSVWWSGKKYNGKIIVYYK